MSSLCKTLKKDKNEGAHPSSCEDAGKMEEQDEKAASSRLTRAESQSSELDLPILPSVYVDGPPEETAGAKAEDEQLSRPNKFSWKCLFRKDGAEKEQRNQNASAWKRSSVRESVFGEKAAPELPDSQQRTPNLLFDFDWRRIVGYIDETGRVCKSESILDVTTEEDHTQEAESTTEEAEEKPDKSGSTAKKLMEVLKNIGIFVGLAVFSIAVLMLFGLVVIISTKTRGD